MLRLVYFQGIPIINNNINKIKKEHSIYILSIDIMI